MVPLQPWMTHGLAENSFTSEGMAAVRDSLRSKPYSPSSAARYLLLSGATCNTMAVHDWGKPVRGYRKGPTLVTCRLRPVLRGSWLV